MDELAHKRRKQSDQFGSRECTSNALWSTEPEIPPIDIFSNIAFFMEPTAGIGSGVTTDTGNAVRRNKRNREDELDPTKALSEIPDQTWAELMEQLPQLFPSTPTREDHAVDTALPNPFADESASIRYSSLERRCSSIPTDGAVCGYVKFRIRVVQSSSSYRRFHSSTNNRDKCAQQATGSPFDIVPKLPRDFERVVKLDSLDAKLHKFFLVGYCSGRTLLHKDNFWLADIAPMMARSELVKHSLLSNASGYMLDFTPVETLQVRANMHYKRAVNLLSSALQEIRPYQAGGEEALIASIILLMGDDIVKWELRRPKHTEQRWYAAAKIAKQILDASDPGYRYWKPENVQTSNARHSLSNWLAYANILAEPVTSLSHYGLGKIYPWLLEGTPENIRKIHGGTGVSPKLLHTFAQITHLAARLDRHPNSVVVLLGAQEIDTRLRNFRQWSDLSDGYDSAEALFADCVTDASGKVDSTARITDLTGQAWLAAAQIYLYCRFYRLPRMHPTVRECLSKLTKCIAPMPFSGILFTAQAPFFPIFIMALVSVTPEDRRVAAEWFETVASGAGDRSSVPPIWDSLKRIWTFIDEKLTEDKVEDDKPVSERIAWWEDIVVYIIKNEGLLSLV